MVDALAYAADGLYVFPLHSVRADGSCSCGRGDACKQRGKHPRTLHGFKDATRDPETIRGWWRAWPDAGVGMACGPSRRIVLDLDIDKDKNGEAAFAALRGLELEGVDLIASTPRGGRHLFYAMPPGEPVTSTQSKIAPGIDTRAMGGYVVLPSAASPDRNWLVGEPGDELSPPPAWLDALLPRASTTREKSEHSAAQSSTGARADSGIALALLPETVASIRSALVFVCNDEREDWLKVGMALKSTGAQQQAYDLWVEWSRSTANSALYQGAPGDHPKFDAADHLRVWRSLSKYFADGTEITLRTLFWLAQEHGYVEPVDAPPTSDATAPAEPVDETTGPTPAPTGDDEPFPVSLLDGDDLIGEWSRWIIGTAPRQQPALALANVLPALGAVIGRRVQTESRLRTNIYALAVAPSGHGKDHPQRTAPEALALAMLDRRIGGDWASASGARTALARSPSHCAWIDELGLWLAAIRGRNAPQHLVAIGKHLLEAFSAASGTMIGQTYADPRQNPRVDILEPNLCLVGSSTPDVLFEALGGDAIHGGLLGRMLVFWGEGTRPPRSATAPGMDELRDRVVARLVELDVATRPAGSSETLAPGTDTALATHCRTVPYSPEARALLGEIETWSDARVDELERAKDRCAPLWIRFAEHCQKVALIHALARDPRAAEITAADVRWAGDLVQWCTERLHRTAAGRIADTEYEADLLRVWRAIQEAGPAGITSSQLAKKLRRISSRTRKEALTHLIEAGAVTQEVTMTAGRPFTTYRVARGGR
ncbi:MAG: bifunctional DNA primase/polymerase [Planctomycetes bacterium]|nr:bifunctional DNA primase/polymerase [Planctomycetota bacterium]